MSKKDGKILDVDFKNKKVNYTFNGEPLDEQEYEELVNIFSLALFYVLKITNNKTFTKTCNVVFTKILNRVREDHMRYH